MFNYVIKKFSKYQIFHRFHAKKANFLMWIPPTNVRNQTNQATSDKTEQLQTANQMGHRS